MISHPSRTARPEGLLVSLWNPDFPGDTNGRHWQNAGFLHTKGPHRGRFVYRRDYDGPPLDPLHLDYRTQAPGAFFDPPGQDRLFDVFQDALPGHFGIGLLARHDPGFQDRDALEQLATFGRRAHAGLLFRPYGPERTDERDLTRLAELEAIQAQLAGWPSLETDLLTPTTFYALTSLGGARPKASVCLGGRYFVAKFNLPGDPYTSLARVEHATLRLAAAAGLCVPASSVVTLPESGADVLLVERYDRSRQHRAHNLSLRTLTGIDNVGTRRSDVDAREVDRVLGALKTPVGEHHEWIRRVAFMAGIQDADNHLGNTAMQLDAHNAWGLTPVYDLVPVTGNPPFATRLAGFPDPRQALTPHFVPAISRLFARPLDEVQALVTRTWAAMGAAAEDVFREARVCAADRALLREAIPLATLSTLVAHAAPGLSSSRAGRGRTVDRQCR